MITSCEDVIEVDLNTAAPRLVVEANINLLENGTSESTVKLTTTAPFFDNQIPVVNDAIVTITASNGEVSPFTYSENGIYVSNLIPQENIEYTLEIIYNNETYTSTNTLRKAVPLEFVTQRNDGGFSGEDIELKAFFTDPGGIQNFYYFEGLSNAGDSFDVLDDEFFDGNTIFGFYLIEDLEQGDVVTFNLYGVDQQFYNFMFILLQQISDGGGGPFETQPATVRGNVVNRNNTDNFPLGYFRISEKYTLIYTVE